MGIIRFLLAVSVLITHTKDFWGLTLLNGDTAIRSFYVISGFYMALILNNRYKKIGNFYLNRFLRLIPSYWIVLILSFVGYYCLHKLSIPLPSTPIYQFFESWQLLIENNRYIDILILFFTNCFLFGSEILLLIDFQGNFLHFVPNHSLALLPGYRLLLIPVIWTLGLELCFYILAPLLCRLKYPYLLVVFVISILLNINVVHYIHNGLGININQMAIFPFELIYFCLGILSFRLYILLESNLSKENNSNLITAVGLIFLGLLFCLFVTFIYWREFGLTNNYYYYLFALLIPIIFQAFKNNVFDRYIGEYSYLIYIIHLPLRNIIEAIASKYSQLEIFYSNYSSGIILILTCLLASVLIRLLKPFETLRSKIRNTQLVQ